MSKTKHTPGPWEVDAYAYGTKPPRVDLAIRAEGVRLSQIDNNGPDDETANANARLIAAAPELLQAAQNLMADIDKDDIAGVGYTPARHLALADAIFKATA